MIISPSLTKDIVIYSVKKLVVKDFPVMVTLNCHGGNIYKNRK